MAAKKSTWTEDLEEDFRAWLDDIDAEMQVGDMSDIEKIVDTIWNSLPEFVQSWTVSELCSAIRDR